MYSLPTSVPFKIKLSKEDSGLAEKDYTFFFAHFNEK